MDQLNDLSIRKQQGKTTVDYDPKKHGRLLAEKFERGDRWTIGSGQDQVEFNPIGADNSATDRVVRT